MDEPDLEFLISLEKLVLSLNKIFPDNPKHSKEYNLNRKLNLISNYNRFLNLPFKRDNLEYIVLGNLTRKINIFFNDRENIDYLLSDVKLEFKDLFDWFDKIEITNKGYEYIVKHLNNRYG